LDIYNQVRQSTVSCEDQLFFCQKALFSHTINNTHLTAQKGKTNLDLLEQKTVSGSGISWAICKSAPHPRQITTPSPHHSAFYRPDAFPATQPTVSSHTITSVNNHHSAMMLLVK